MTQDAKAPERIWILRDVQGRVYVFDERGDAPDDTRDDIEYVRADLLTAAEAERDRLAGLLEEAKGALEWCESRRQEAVSRAKAIHAPEDEAVLVLCQHHGYGAVIDSACRQWANIAQGGTAAFFVGGCIGDTTVSATLAKLEKEKTDDQD